MHYSAPAAEAPGGRTGGAREASPFLGGPLAGFTLGPRFHASSSGMLSTHRIRVDRA